MSRVNVRTNKADFVGSVFYNINRMTGYTFGVSPADHYLYSDGGTENGVLVDYITLEPLDEKGEDIISALTYDHTVWKRIFNEDDYYNGDWFLFGQTWLPWFAPPPTNDGKGWLRRGDPNDNSVSNKASIPVLIPTAMSAVKVLGITLAAYYGVNYGYRIARQQLR